MLASYDSSAAERLEKLSSFQPLDSAQTSFLRGIFLSMSDRPNDQSHVRAFVRAHYRDIPVEARGSLGPGILEMFNSTSAPPAAASEAAAASQRSAGAFDDLAAAAVPVAAVPSNSEQQSAPRITARSFQRVCAAMGLHMNEKEVAEVIRKFSSEEPPPPASSAAAAAAAASSSAAIASPAPAAPAPPAFVPGLSFDDFLVFYASLSKPLSPSQELQEVWRLLDEHLDGRVPLRVLRQTMLGMERSAPSTGSGSGALSGGASEPRFFDTHYKYHFTATQRALSPEQLIDQFMANYFVARGKDLDTDTITFQEFVEFMYA